MGQRAIFNENTLLMSETVHFDFDRALVETKWIFTISFESYLNKSAEKRMLFMICLQQNTLQVVFHYKFVCDIL